MISDFSISELGVILANAGILITRCTQYSDDYVMSLTTPLGDPKIIISKRGGWWTFERNISGNFEWDLRNTRRQYPLAKLKVRNIKQHPPISSLSFRISVRASLEAFVESIRAVFNAIVDNKENIARMRKEVVKRESTVK